MLYIPIYTFMYGNGMKGLFKLCCAGRCSSHCILALLCALLQILLGPSCPFSVNLNLLRVLLLCCLAVMQQHGNSVLILVMQTYYVVNCSAIHCVTV